MIFAAHWPYVPGDDSDRGEVLNSVRKHVVSRTLSSVGWNNSTLIERAVILSSGSQLAVPLGELQRKPGNGHAFGSSTTLEQVEREHIRRALEQTQWLVGGPSGAAAILGIKRTTLQSKMIKFGIERPRHRGPRDARLTAA